MGIDYLNLEMFLLEGFIPEASRVYQAPQYYWTPHHLSPSFYRSRMRDILLHCHLPALVIMSIRDVLLVIDKVCYPACRRSCNVGPNHIGVGGAVLHVQPRDTTT